MDIQGDYVSLGEAARALGVTKPRVSQLLGSGLLDGSLVGGRRMVARASLEAYREGKSRRPHTHSTESFVLMSADYEIAHIDYDAQREFPFSVREVLDAERMPFGTVTSNGSARRRLINDWWAHRSVPNTRPGIIAKLDVLGFHDASRLPLRSLGLSLSDCYWLRPKNRDNLAWKNINYFDNDFEGSGTDNWDEWLGAVGLDSPDNTSEGELPKRWAIKNGKRVLIKGCASDDQRPFNEVVATALHRRLLEQGEYVPYGIVHVHGDSACCCPDFLGPREEYIPAVYIKNGMGSTRGSSTYDRIAYFAGRWLCDEEQVRMVLSQMIVCDALLANSDRHWRNFGFIRSVDTLEMRPAPLFDSGNSLWYEKDRASVQKNDWKFTARPFDVNPDRQLALADRFDWFDATALDGFVDEAVELLTHSRSVVESGRLDFIAEGLRERVRSVSAAVGALRYVVR